MKNRFLLAFLTVFMLSANSYATNPSGTIPVAFSLYKSASISSIQGFNFGKIVIDTSLLSEGDNRLAVFDGATDALSDAGNYGGIQSLSVTGTVKQAEFTLTGNGISGFTLTPPVGAAQSCTFTTLSGESDSDNECGFSSPVTLETGVTLGNFASNSHPGPDLVRTGTAVKFAYSALKATKTYLETDSNYTTPNKSYNMTLTVNY